MEPEKRGKSTHPPTPPFGCKSHLQFLSISNRTHSRFGDKLFGIRVNLGTNYLESEPTSGQIAWNYSHFGDKSLGTRANLGTNYLELYSYFRDKLHGIIVNLGTNHLEL